MKETIYTIPVNEAFQSGDECPFCYLERMAEQKAIHYTLGPGASYMEPGVRAETDAQGFCREHLKKLYDYGNALGNALILQTYYVGMLRQLEQQLDNYELPPKRGLLRKKATSAGEKPLIQWLAEQEKSCFVCNRIQYNMSRYYASFFFLIREAEFRESVENSKGFCLRHFRELLETAETELPNNQREWFQKTVFSSMWDNLCRVKEDLDWFVAKNDYRNAGLDWKNSRDALNRAMQKLRGLYPADPPYKSDIFGKKK